MDPFAGDNMHPTRIKREREDSGQEMKDGGVSNQNQRARTDTFNAALRQFGQPANDVSGLSNSMLSQQLMAPNPQLAAHQQLQQLQLLQQQQQQQLLQQQQQQQQQQQRNQLLGGQLNPFGVPAAAQPNNGNDPDTMMRQLNASQLQLMSQTDVSPAVLLQLFAMQNQAMTQSMRRATQQAPFALPQQVPYGGGVQQMVDPAAQAIRGLQAAGGGVAVEPPAVRAAPSKPVPPAGCGVTGRPPLVLYTGLDEGRLTPYQCLARKHLEYFEADQTKVEEGAQGRNKAIVLGQVGIRCIHCSELKRKEKAPAAAFYPSKLSGLYQSAQNIINSHLAKDCTKVPNEIRDQLLNLGNRKSAPGGGKSYWAEEATRVGVFEDTNGLRFTAQVAPAPQQSSAPRGQRVPAQRPPVQRQLEP